MDQGTLLQQFEKLKEELKRTQEESKRTQEELKRTQEEFKRTQDETQEEFKRTQDETQEELKRTQDELRKNKLSRMDWLQQALPQMPLEFGGKPAARRENLDYAPSTFVEWTSFREDVQSAAATKEDGIFFKEFSWSGLRHIQGSNERPVTLFSSQVLVTMMEFAFPEFGMMCSPSKRQKLLEQSSNVDADSFLTELSHTSGAYRVDHLIKRMGIDLLPVEVKSPSAFRTSEKGSPADLVEQYQKFREDGSNALIGDIIRQAVLYMDLCHLRYCVITSVDLWYFLKWRIDEASNTFTCLEISCGIAYDSKNPTVLQSLHYFLTLANEEAEKFLNYRFESASDTGSESDDELKETLASNLHCKSLLASGGWSGNVLFGKVEGQKAAIKVAPRFSTLAEALINEMTAYKQLTMYWGQYIPDLLGYGISAQGKVVFIATKFIDGRIISQESFNDAVGVAAREGLAAIHGVDILHGDIHRDNILVLPGGGVRFIDFGFATFGPNDEERRRERKKLEKILQNMVK